MPDPAAPGFSTADLLGWTPVALNAIEELRGWTLLAIERLELAYLQERRRIGIPIRDEGGDELGELAYDPTGEHPPKMLAPAGVPRCLFPPPEMIADRELDEHRTVWLVEGEPDAIRMWSLGLPAVAVPGAANWRDEDAARFVGRRWRVIVCFDADQAGRAGAQKAAAAIVDAGGDARVLELDASRDDGFDISDFARHADTPEARADAAQLLRQAADKAVLYTPPPSSSSSSNGAEPNREPKLVIFEPLRDFLRRDLPPALALVGVTRNGTNLLPRYGWVMPWGREGSGKTSVLVDLLYHAAAGVDWLGYPLARPLRIIAIVNEGIPGGFQDKLSQKLETWQGGRELVLDNIAIYASPWGEFTFRDQTMVDHARAYALDFGADYVALDPLHTLGPSGSGRPEDTEAFKHLLRGFGLWDDIGIITAHHSNKSGMVSGDWARHPDTVVHLEKDGKNPATKFTLEKARPADPHELGVPCLLEWDLETLGYRRVEMPGHVLATDEELLARIRDALADAGRPLRMGELQAAVRGDSHRVQTVALEALKTGVLRDTEPRAGWYAFVPGGEQSTGSTGSPENEAQTRMDTDDLPGESTPPDTPSDGWRQ